ncbi:MAG: hypothetical protein ABL927_08835 [Bdellovibrionales bacterium]
MTKNVLYFSLSPVFSSLLKFVALALLSATLTIFPQDSAFAAFTNYSSVMLGDRAGGMGGAFTSLTGDTAASSYYNPATLARLNGSSLSASVNLFNKYDISYGNVPSLDDAIFRINKGSILSVPGASGIFSNFKNFSAGLSILTPDFQMFGGDVYAKGNDSTFLRVNDQSLWVGGSLALNIAKNKSIGVSAYYTSQSYSRSLLNRYDTGTEIIVQNEEKTFSTNSIIYILGYYQEISQKWRLGLSYRFKSIPISGTGSYLHSEIGTVSGAQPVIHKDKINFETRVPDRLAFGVSYVREHDLTVSADLSYFGSNNYNNSEVYSDHIITRDVLNASIGVEKYLLPWLPLRLGLFTDFSSTPSIPSVSTRRFQDHIDHYGLSANIGIHTTEHTTVTLGGYSAGGVGSASELIGPSYQKIKKAERVFSFLVGSSYSF